MNEQSHTDAARRHYAHRVRREISMRLTIIFFGLALGYGAWLAVRAVKIVQRGGEAGAKAER